MTDSINCNRREFIRVGAAGIAAASAAVGATDAAERTAGTRSRVVKVTHSHASSDADGFNTEIVKKLVDRSMREFTGKDSTAAAWKTFFSPDDVVGIKINCLAAKHMQFASHPCVVNAIVDGLKQAGVKPNNIIIWDRRNDEMELAGYTINESNDGVRCFGTDRGLTMKDETGKRRRRPDRKAARKFYAKEPVDVAGVPVYLSKLIDEMTAIVNVPLVKDHRVAGLTLSLKNHYGSIMNPYDLHNTCGDPYIAALNTVPAIKKRQRLIVTDFLQSVFDGGPGFKPEKSWRENSIMVGTDPVALDAIGLGIIEQKRKENGLSPLNDKTGYIQTAAKMGLGTANHDEIDLKEIDIT